MTRSLILLAVLLFISMPADAENMRLRRHQVEEETITTSDIEAEIMFGREVAARIIGKYTVLKNDELTKYVNLVGKSVALHGNRPEIDFVFGVLDSDVINAFAAPGGYVFITRGAIEAMENEAALAGVLAHEIIHVNERHIVRELNIHGSSSFPVEGFARIIGGATDAAKIAFVRAVDEAVNILFDRGYKKQDEHEADTLGIILSASANYNPEALVEYFEQIKERTEPPGSYSSLHQPFDERIADLRETIKEEGLAGVHYLTGKERFDAYTSKKN